MASNNEAHGDGGEDTRRRNRATENQTPACLLHAPIVPYGPCTLLCRVSDEKQAAIPFNLASVPQSC